MYNFHNPHSSAPRFLWKMVLAIPQSYVILLKLDYRRKEGFYGLL